MSYILPSWKVSQKLSQRFFFSFNWQLQEIKMEPKIPSTRFKEVQNGMPHLYLVTCYYLCVSWKQTYKRRPIMPTKYNINIYVKPRRKLFPLFKRTSYLSYIFLIISKTSVSILIVFRKSTLSTMFESLKFNIS